MDIIDKSKPILPKRTGLMTEGLLEVLLVKAEGIQHKNHIGSPAYYVVAECGCLVHKSKVTSGKGDKVLWNEKFSYKFPICEWNHSTHLKLKIMNSRLFGGGICVGETTIYLGGIVGDGIERDLAQEVRPSPYNVVLEDDTYRGEVVVGLKFITTNVLQMKPDIETEDCVTRNGNGDTTKPPSLWRSKISTWKIWGWKLLFSYSKRIARDKKKIA